MESQVHEHEQPSSNKTLKGLLLGINLAVLVVGCTASPLLLRLYFLRGGTMKWLSCWLQTAGWPLTLLPLSLSYFHRRRREGSPRLYFMTPPLLLACTGLGVLTVLYDILYAYGETYLPVSTSSILMATQLAFVALFASLIVRQRFTAYSLGAVALLSLGAILLGVSSGGDGDEPKDESAGEYYMGFFMTLTAAAIIGVIMPLVELIYARANQAMNYTLVMEIQLVVSFAATAMSTLGMLINKDFQAIPREARAFSLGEFMYYMLLVWTAIVCQFFLLGTVGSTFYASALLTGVFQALLLPVTQLLAVLFFHEQLTALKGVALASSLCGFASYLYGDYKSSTEKKQYVLLDSEN